MPNAHHQSRIHSSSSKCTTAVLLACKICSLAFDHIHSDDKKKVNTKAEATSKGILPLQISPIYFDIFLSTSRRYELPLHTAIDSLQPASV